MYVKRVKKVAVASLFFITGLFHFTFAYHSEGGREDKDGKKSEVRIAPAMDSFQPVSEEETLEGDKELAVKVNTKGNEAGAVIDQYLEENRIRREIRESELKDLETQKIRLLNQLKTEAANNTGQSSDNSGLFSLLIIAALIPPVAVYAVEKKSISFWLATLLSFAALFPMFFELYDASLLWIGSVAIAFFTALK